MTKEITGEEGRNMRPRPLPPHILELGEEARRRRAFLARLRLAEGFQQFALLRAQAGGRFDVDLHHHVAHAAAVEHGHTRAALAQLLAGLDAGGNAVKVSSVFSWRERDFTAAFADKADAKFASRSPMERAVLAFMAPRLLTTEREFLDRNQFELRYIPFDWSLNDLTGR